MRQGFRDLGYVEGRNLAIEYRWADGHYERLPALAAELVRLKPDVIVTSGPGVAVLKDATTTVPVVMAAAGDVVAMGLVASLAHPGGNLTGSTFFGPELSAKRLEILRSAVPRLGRVAVLQRPSACGCSSHCYSGQTRSSSDQYGPSNRRGTEWPASCAARKPTVEPHRHGVSEVGRW
jgi:putative ABC transport system substrate-binding protein